MSQFTGPIEYNLISVKSSELELGYHGSHTDFVWRPYEERSEEARADYDLLEESILKDRLQKPLITFNGHVLIGMRRLEIFWKHFGFSEEIACADILEDVYLWDRYDILRLNEMKAVIGEYEYT